MSREWKPGDVAMVTCPDTNRVGIRRPGVVSLVNGWATADGWFSDATVTDVRPLVVLDPEDAKQVDTLSSALMRQLVYPHAVPYRDAIPAALRSLIAPTWEDVYEHLVVSDKGGVATAMCGKVWRPEPRTEVNILGKCPECSQASIGGWVA